MIVSIVCQIFVIVRRRGAFKWKFNLWVWIQLLYDGIPAYWYREEVVTVTQAQRYRKNYSLIVNIDSACRKRLKEGSIRINIYLDRLSKCNNISRLTGGAAHTQVGGDVWWLVTTIIRSDHVSPLSTPSSSSSSTWDCLQSLMSVWRKPTSQLLSDRSLVNIERNKSYS